MPCSAVHVDLPCPQVNIVTSVHALVGAGHTVDQLTLTYQYVAGYTPPPGEKVPGSTFSIIIADAQTLKPVSAHHAPVPGP